MKVRSVMRVLSLACALSASSVPAAVAGVLGAARPATDDGDELDLAELRLPRGDMRGVIERYETDRNNLRRAYDVNLSPTRRRRMRQFYNDWFAALRRLDFDALGAGDRIDYLLLENQISSELRRLDLSAQSRREAAPLLPFARVITDLADAREAMKPADAPRSAEVLSALAKQIDETRKAVEAAFAQDAKPRDAGATDGVEADRLHVKKPVANRAAGMVDELRGNLGQWFRFYNGYDPVFTWWANEPYQVADRALQSYAAFLRERVVGIKAGDEIVIIGDPIGREGLLAELAHEMITYSPEELLEIAQAEFAWCEKQMKRAAREMGQDDWHKALELVKNKHVAPGEQPEMIRKLALEAIEFLDDHELVSVPPLAREVWRMDMMSPERQLVTPFFTGGEVISVSFPTNTMTHEQKLMTMRGNNVHFSRATVHHELIPGHHLQGFMLARYRPYRRLFNTPFWLEGWAVYWETLLWDLDFARSPEDRIGMLFWRMHRCARIIFSLSFHLEQMTPQECIDFLVERVGHERDNAAAEVRRSFNGSYPPLYQCGYLLGALQFRALHHELVDSGRMTNRAFHDAILKENTMPVELVRACLKRQKLPRDFKPEWRFYPLKKAND